MPPPAMSCPRTHIVDRRSQAAAAVRGGGRYQRHSEARKRADDRGIVEVDEWSHAEISARELAETGGERHVERARTLLQFPPAMIDDGPVHREDALGNRCRPGKSREMAASDPRRILPHQQRPTEAYEGTVRTLARAEPPRLRSSRTNATVRQGPSLGRRTRWWTPPQRTMKAEASMKSRRCRRG